MRRCQVTRFGLLSIQRGQRCDFTSVLGFSTGLSWTSCCVLNTCRDDQSHNSATMTSRKHQRPQSSPPGVRAGQSSPAHVLLIIPTAHR